MAEQECLGGAPLSTLEVTLGGQCLAPSMSSRWEVAFSKGFLSSETGPQLQKPQLSLSSSYLPREPTWRTHRTPGQRTTLQTGRHGGGCLMNSEQDKIENFPRTGPGKRLHTGSTGSRGCWGHDSVAWGRGRHVPRAV